jgi:integrase
VCLHLFFQRHADDINALPDVLVGGVSLLPELLKESRAMNTSEAYRRGFKRWCDWALSNNLTSEDTFPAKAFHVALYMTSLIQTAQSPSPIVNAFYSIKWYHDLLDLQSPTDSNLVKNVLEAAKRRLSKHSNRKEPISVSVLEQVFHCLYKENNVFNQRTICALLLSYAAFLRSSELLNLKRCDIIIYPMYMSIFIQSSKTDKYRDGAWVPLARTGTVLCPVVNLERYFVWAKIPSDSECFVFSQLSKTKEGFKLRQCDKHLSYSNLRKLLIDAIKPFVSDIKCYGLHSLRSGGATAAANMGIPDRLFKRHGRWSSESAKDGYVKDSIDDRLRVSKCLGL